MADYHLDTLWRPEQGKHGAMEFVLTNLSDAPLRDFSLYFGAITRTELPSDAVGGQLLRRQANYHEYRATDVELAPGQQWHLTERSLTRRALHSNEGPKSAGLLLAEERAAVFAADLQAAQPLAVDPVVDRQAGVLPQPQQVDVTQFWSTAPAHLLVTGDLALQREAAKVTALTRRLHPLTPNPFVLAAPEGTVTVSAQQVDLPLDGYRLEFVETGVQISYGAGAGLFYALVSLAQLHCHAHQSGATSGATYGFPLQGVIEDAPRHGWRGAHLDVSRQFYKMGKVLRYVDLMAWHKMNRFHWHLTDDEGWRLEIKAYPQLTEVAAATGHDLPVLPQLGASEEGQAGYYTQDQVRGVIAHAGALGIEVMPEIDLPGHCACVIGALPELVDSEETPASYHSIQGFANNALNPAMESSYVLAERILSEVCELFPFEAVHVGGDEVADDAWMQSPKAQAMMKETGLKGTFELQAHFLRHLQQFLAARGKKIAGWEEMAHGGGVDRENCLLFAWTTVEKTAELAEAGYDVISTPGQAYYLDMAQSDAWYEPGASWAGFTPVSKTYAFEALNDSAALAERLKGVQACVWSEHLTTMERVNHQVFPRLSAIAEAGWTAAAQKDFTRFEALSGLMPRL